MQKKQGVELISVLRYSELFDVKSDSGGTPRSRHFSAAVLGDVGRDVWFYIARVLGASQAPINEAALAEVLNWVLREFFDAAALPDGFNSLTIKEVQRARSRVLADPLKYRSQFWSSEAIY